VRAGARDRPPHGGAPGEATADSFKNRPDSFKRMLGSRLAARYMIVKPHY